MAINWINVQTQRWPLTSGWEDSNVIPRDEENGRTGFERKVLSSTLPRVLKQDEWV